MKRKNQSWPINFQNKYKVWVLKRDPFVVNMTEGLSIGQNNFTERTVWGVEDR